MSRTQFVLRQAQFVFAGNSLTAGSSATSADTFYPTVCMKSLRSGEPFQNFGTPSQTTPQMATAAFTQVYPLYDAKRKCVLVAWEGTNDLFSGGASAATCYANLVNYCLAGRAKGFLVILLTIIDCQNAGRPGSFDADRATVNTNLRTNASQFCDSLADAAGVAALSNANDTTYFASDKLHLIDAGYAVVAATVKTSIEGLRR